MVAPARWTMRAQSGLMEVDVRRPTGDRPELCGSSSGGLQRGFLPSQGCSCAAVPNSGLGRLACLPQPAASLSWRPRGPARRGPRRSSPARARHLPRPSPRRWPSTCARRGRWAWDPACAARRRGRRPLQQRDRGSGVLLLPRGAPERRQARRGGVEARIFIRERPDRLEFEIRDEGQGFRHRVGAAEGRGLTNMQERLAALGGTLEVESAPGGGTRVRGGVPLGADR